MESPELPPMRSRRDGCQCPEIVRGCAHLGSRVIQLRVFAGLEYHQVCGPTPVDNRGFHIGECDRIDFPDLPAAEAEFHRREALLLEPANV